MIQDPLFEPWSGHDRESASADAAAHSGGTTPHAPSDAKGTVDFLRSTGVSLLNAVSARLQQARHDASLHDLLEEPPHVLRFELTPWPGPLTESASGRVATLEIGSEHDRAVTAWYWLDRSSEAPDRITSIPSTQLTAVWLERVILDFVAHVLGRS